MRPAAAAAHQTRGLRLYVLALGDVAFRRRLAVAALAVRAGHQIVVVRGGCTIISPAAAATIGAWPRCSGASWI